MRGTVRRARAAGLVIGVLVAGPTACTGDTDGGGTDRETGPARHGRRRAARTLAEAGGDTWAFTEVRLPAPELDKDRVAPRAAGEVAQHACERARSGTPSPSGA